MAFLALIINIVAVFLNIGKTQVSGFAVASLISSIWAYGIFSNYRRDPLDAPSYAVFLSTLSGIFGIMFIVVGAIA